MVFFSVEDDAKKKKQIALEIRQNEMVKRCESKVARHLLAKQKEICNRELSRAREAFDRKEREIEMAHRLVAELPRRKNEEIKRDNNLGRIKSSSQSLLNCDLSEVRSRLIEEKIRTDKMGEREKNQSRKMIDREIGGKNGRNKKTKDAILSREDLTASLAARNKWERKYKKALRDEDEKITCMVAEKQARDEKILNEKIEVCAAIDATIDTVTKTFWTMSKQKTGRN